MQVKPRGEGKIKIDKGAYDGYIHYCNAVKDKPEKYKLDRGTYGKVLKEIHIEIMNRILMHSETYRMPCGLGGIRIKKYRRKPKFKEDGKIDPRSLAVNWKRTREIWAEDKEAKKNKKLVYFINDHFNGYSVTFKLEKHSVRVPHAVYYSFKASRANQRKLSTIVLDPYNKIDYYT